MTGTPFFFVDLSPEGAESIACRYSTSERYREWEERDVVGEDVPSGTAKFFPKRLVLKRGPEIGHVLASGRIIPWDGGAWVEYTAVRRDGETYRAPLPFRSDLGDGGVCRCGCGVGLRDGQWYDAEAERFWRDIVLLSAGVVSPAEMRAMIAAEPIAPGNLVAVDAEGRARRARPGERSAGAAPDAPSPDADAADAAPAAWGGEDDGW